MCRDVDMWAIQVDNAAAARKKCNELGVTIRETTPIPGAERFFVNDPDGNRIEIIQWTDRGEIRVLKKWEITCFAAAVFAASVTK